MELNRYDEAVKIFDNGMPISPNDETLLTGIWTCLLLNKRYEEATRRIQDFTEANPKSTIAFLFWGNCLYMQERLSRGYREIRARGCFKSTESRCICRMGRMPRLARKI